MKKKLFFVLGLLMAVVVQAWAEELLCQTVFNSSNNSGRISSYTNEWTNTTDGFTVAIVNANNNNNAWEYIKFGSKNDASVGSITTANPISAKIERVVVTIDAVTAAKVNSITLLTSFDGTTYMERASYTVATGAQSASVPADIQETGLYYQIKFDCQKGSNGMIQVSKVEFYGEVGGDDPGTNPGTDPDPDPEPQPDPTATLSADADTVQVGDIVHFSFVTQNTEMQELVELVYQRTTGTVSWTTTNPYIEFTSSGNYGIYARIRVDNDNIILSDTVNVYVKAQTPSVTINASDIATEQVLEAGDPVDPFTKGLVTMTFSAGTGSTVSYNGSAPSMKSGNILSFSVPAGYRITGIDIYPSSYSQKTYLVSGSNATWTSGVATSVLTNTATPVVWEGIAQEVSVTVKGAVAISKVIVRYATTNQNYYITFCGEDGEILVKQKLLLGTYATPPTPPTIQDKTFIGWKTSEDGTAISSSDVASKVVRTNVTYTAYYQFNADVLNETTTITMKAVLNTQSTPTVGIYTFDALDYEKNSKNLYFNKGTNNTGMGWHTNGYCSLYNGNTIRIKSNNMMHKISFIFSNNAQIGYVDGPGKWSVSGTYLIWEGSSADVTFTCNTKSANDVRLQTIEIKSDVNRTTATVTFVDQNDNILQQQSLALHSKVTAPTPPATTKTGMYVTWDKTVTRAVEDVTYKAVEVPIIDMDITSTYYSKNYVATSEAGYNSSLTENNATVYSRYSSLTVYDSIKVKSAVEEPIRTIRITSDKALKPSVGTVKIENGVYVWFGVSHEVTFRSTSVISTSISAIQVLSTPQTVTVTFLAADSSLITKQEVEVGSIVSSPAVPVIAEKEQTGWMVNGTFVSLEDFATMPIMKTTICVAHYEYNVFTVTFRDAEGRLIGTQKVNKGEYAVSPEFEMPEGNALDGWIVNGTFVSIEDFATMPVTDFITCVAQYKRADGYHTITFLTQKGDTIQSRYVQDGTAAAVPEAPIVAFHRFVGWYVAGSADVLTSEQIAALLVEGDANYTAVYELDLEHATPLTVDEAHTTCSQLPKNIQTEEMYFVKGVVSDNLSFKNDTVVSFKMNWENGTAIQVDTTKAPIRVRSELQKGDTVLVYAYLYPGSSKSYNALRGGYIVAILNSRNWFPTKPAHLMYDFTGDGIKDYMLPNDYTYLLMERTENGKYRATKELFEESSSLSRNAPKFIEDINNDGKPDISMWSSYTMVSGEEGYTRHDSMSIITNFDINRDGRQDYIFLNQSQAVGSGTTIHFGDIAYQQADGTFHSETMQVMTWPEFQAQMTPEELAQMNNPGDYSLGDVSRYVYTISYYNMVGADLASAPKRRAARKAQSVGHILSAPTKAIDLNADGMMDLVDEKDGVIYTNMGNAKWVMTATNGTVIPADLNGDGVTDFIFPGSNLYVSIFNKTTNSFTTTNLYSNAAVDETVYTYDFDRDGDIDILATFTAANNATKTAYTCFFRNDGNGNFTRLPEQSYGSNNLLFENLQDINGDGYLDLLAIRGNITTGKSTLSPWYFNIPDSSEVVWLQGQAALQFAQPDSLFIIPKGFRQNIGAISSHIVEYEYPLQAEDLDNDGKIDIWMSGLSSAVTLALRNSYTYTSAQANAAPTAPAAPELQYNDGLLTITWGNGSDDHTMPCDLTYALRIGTSSGAMDIVRPHANADGSRRNFLDGNAGRAHSYSIDLSSYSPSDIYVAVQAIDAQHVGSAWSEEASVRHEKLPAEFTLSSEVIRLNEKLTITFTPMPEGYTHTWSVGDGVINEVSASQIEVSFPVGGEKTITHTLTSPDNKQAVSEQTMRVLPADVSRLDDYLTYDLFGKAQADINYDGRADVFSSSAVMVGTNSSNYATQAEGLWNTNFLTPSWHPTPMWYDYNRDGQVDLMLEENYGSSYQYAYLPHAANAPTLSDRVDDDAIENLFGYFIRDNMGREIGRVVCLQRDFTHNGRYDVFEKNRDAQNQDVLYLRVQQEDGTYATQTSNMALYEFMNGEETYKRFAEDINHDGFIDLVLMNPSALKVAYNRGGGVFDIQSIPFANDLGYDYYKPSLVDFNGDGYLDLLYVSGKAVYVMWNTTNSSYSVPIHLLDNAGDEISILDIDANGYPDIATTMTDPATKLHGLYIWFMGPNGVVIEGKFMDNVASSTYGTKGAYLACGESYLMSTYSYRLLPQNEDAAPAVPFGLTAQSTDDGLLIQWNDAADDHTPAALMRYNLAVRLQGSTTYLISPLNGANNGTMPLSDYRYISATQFLIPSSALTTGTYEIQLQALDMQQHFSNFTPVLTATYTRTNVFEMDEEACTNDEVLISYRGAVGQSSPSWTFDGGSIVSGNGYGPYTVTWNSGGDKRVTITVDGVTYADTIYISNPREMQVYIPSTLLMDQAATAEIPADATAYQWYVRIGEDDDVVYKIGSNGIDMSTPARVLYDKRLTVDGLQITAHEISGKTSLTQESIIKLYLVVYNSHGCEVWFMTYATVIGDVVAPTLDLVTVDANAHNVIHFTADAANFPMVRILKETNVFNEFAEVSVVSATNGSYTDMNSNAEQQPDRYKIQGVMANGDYSTESAIHKTVHATINRGVREGTYNLIWNAYEGAEIVTYNILRGSSAATLTQIASVASSATSYTDQAPLDAEPYYVVEYVLVSSPSASPARRAPAASQATLIGRSNIVERESGQTPPEPVYYTIRFLNYDSSVLQSTQVLEGERPVYTGATPAKPEDDNYTYEFSGWSPAILPAFADTDYTAQFTSTRKGQGLEDVQSDNVQCTKVLIDGTIYILRGEKVYNAQGALVK